MWTSGVLGDSGAGTPFQSAICTFAIWPENRNRITPVSTAPSAAWSVTTVALEWISTDQFNLAVDGNFVVRRDTSAHNSNEMWQSVGSLSGHAPMRLSCQYKTFLRYNRQSQ